MRKLIFRNPSSLIVIRGCKGCERPVRKSVTKTKTGATVGTKASCSLSFSRACDISYAGAQRKRLVLRGVTSARDQMETE